MSYLDHKSELVAIGVLSFLMAFGMGMAAGVAVATFRFDAWHFQEHGYHYLEPPPGFNMDGSAEQPPIEA